jgi:hypothetical protein
MHVRQVLARHRGEPSRSLIFGFPIYFQMDQDVCTTVAKELSEHGTRWEMRRATPNLYRNIPAECGVYMFVFQSSLNLELENQVDFRPAWALYVGRAGSASSVQTLKERYRNAYGRYLGRNPEVLWNSNKPRSRNDLLAKYLTIYPLQYWYLIIRDRTKIEHSEERLIKLLNRH